MCSSMKKVTLQGLYEALLHEQYRVEIDPEIIKKAQLSINRMLEIG
ncbi:quinolinate synthase NadA [Ancylomarina sp.]